MGRERYSLDYRHEGHPDIGILTIRIPRWVSLVVMFRKRVSGRISISPERWHPVVRVLFAIPSGVDVTVGPDPREPACPRTPTPRNPIADPPPEDHATMANGGWRHLE